LTVKSFDSQVLFDPFEEQFHLPTAAVQFGDGKRRKIEIVRQKHKSPPVFHIVAGHSAKRSGIELRRFETLKDDRLIAAQARGFVYLAGLAARVIEIAFGASDEEGHLASEGMQASEVDISFVHHVEGARLDRHVVEGGHIVRFSVSYADKTGDIASQIEERMQFDSALAAAKTRPGKQCQAQVDGRGIQSVDGLFQAEAEVVVGVQCSRSANEGLREVGPDAPVSAPIGVGQRASGYLGAKSGMIEIRRNGIQACFDVPQTFAVGQLCEGHCKELVATREFPQAIVSSITAYAGVEVAFDNAIHQLSENQLPLVHGHLLSTVRWNKDAKNARGG
jgi:hypothetical protein